MDRLGRDELFYKIVDGYEEDVIKQLDEMEEVNFRTCLHKINML